MIKTACLPAVLWINRLYCFSLFAPETQQFLQNRYNKGLSDVLPFLNSKLIALSPKAAIAPQGNDAAFYVIPNLLKYFKLTTEKAFTGNNMDKIDTGYK